MSRGKIRFAALISAMFVLFINICAFAKVDIPNHTDRFFINDYANVIDSETEDYIFEKGKAYNANRWGWSATSGWRRCVPSMTRWRGRYGGWSAPALPAATG